MNCVLAWSDFLVMQSSDIMSKNYYECESDCKISKAEFPTYYKLYTCETLCGKK